MIDRKKKGKRELKILVRLFDEDIDIFNAVREDTKCYIDTEVFRIVLRKYHQCMISNKSQPNQEPDH